MKTLKNFFGKAHIKLLCLFIVAMFCAVTALAFSTPIDAQAEKASPTIVSETETIQASRTISTAAQLVSFANLVNAGSNRSDVVTLANNIDMSSYSSFTPIGKSSSYSFKGTFNGNGFAITGLTVTGGSYNRGLFGYTSGATIKNLTIQGGSVTAVAGWCAGAFVGDANNTTLEYCYNFGTTINSATSGANGLGGIVGYASDVTINSCLNSGYVNGTKGATSIDCGGIAGKLISGTIQYCQNSGTVTAGTTSASNSGAGGMAGYMEDGTINKCLNKGAITAKAKENSETSNISVSSYDVDGHDSVSAYGTSTRITKTKYAYIGGMVGYAEAGTIKESANLDSTTYRGNGGYERVHYKLSYKLVDKYDLFWAKSITSYATFYFVVYKEAYFNTMAGYLGDATVNNTVCKHQKVELNDLLVYGNTSDTTTSSTLEEMIIGSRAYYKTSGSGSNKSPFTLGLYLDWSYDSFGKFNPHVYTRVNGNNVDDIAIFWGKGAMDWKPKGYNQGGSNYQDIGSTSGWDLDSSSDPYLTRFYWSDNGSKPS